MECGYTVSDEEMKLFSTKEIADKMNQYYSIGMSALEMKCKEFKTRGLYHLQAKGVNPYNNSFEMLTRDLKQLKDVYKRQEWNQAGSAVEQAAFAGC